MIGVNLRKFLTATSWVLIAFGPLLTALTLVDLASSPEGVVQDKLRALISLAVGLVSPVVTGGLLLALLSIDERLERKA